MVAGRGCGGWKSRYVPCNNLKGRNRGFRMNRELKYKTISVTDLDYAGLPLTLAFSEHLRVISFDVDAGKITD